jgi:hypothetical protein
VDVGSVAMGFPPPYAATESVSSLYDKYKAAKQGVQEGSKILSASGLIESPITGQMYPESVPAFRQMQKAAPEIADKLSKIYQSGGGNNAVRAWLASEEAAQYMNNPAFKQAAESYVGKVPSAMQQVGKVVGPLARGAGRVLGPVGMAMNINDAQQFAEQSQLGERLAQGQGAVAPNAFRNMNVPYGQGFTNTMSPDQAQAVLESGNERDIIAFGGRDRLNELMRQKAAERVIGPVAPQGM